MSAYMQMKFYANLANVEGKCIYDPSSLRLQIKKYNWECILEPVYRYM